MSSSSAGKSNDELVLIPVVGDIVSSYVKNNDIRREELPELIQEVFRALISLPKKLSENELVPPVNISDSVSDTHIICLEDGKRMKTLKRHLHLCFNMTPDQYKQKWGLPKDYPMVAPAYGRHRSKLAKSISLGKKRRSYVVNNVASTVSDGGLSSIVSSNSDISQLVKPHVINT